MSEGATSGPSGRSRTVVGWVLAGAPIVCALACVIWAPPDHVSATTGVLACGAVVAGWFVAGELRSLSISGGFLVYMLAGAFLGPRSAIAAAVLSELVSAARMRTKLRFVLPGYLTPNVIPALLSALLVHALAPADHHRIGFEATVGLGGVIGVPLSYALVAAAAWTLMPDGERFGLSTLIDVMPTILLNVALAVAGAAITVELGVAGLAFALTGVLSISYMSHLLIRARKRSQQYVSLSWGVLAGLIRSLDIRDERASRHAAAVAAFSRDIARAAGMSDSDVELAHTAGLLHDIGHFALSDRVAERGRELTEDDWGTIQRHPEIGADLLKDLGMYGPVAEIVRAHHERIDGRGYPAGLRADEIPEIAKVIAVAEVYDTLTAGDTYRTTMSSFEAVRELRRVAGTQLDPRYVEILTTLLSGEGIEYRHANDARFDEELAMERRIRQAGS